MIKTWHRYFFREILKVFFFFLFSFFFIYSLIEYSMRMDDFFKDNNLRLAEVVLYYVNQFLKRLDFLLPMALLLSTIKVLTTFSTRNEWIVLQAAGLSTRKLLRPFFAVAMGCSLLVYANFEFFLTHALRNIDEFRINHFHGSHLAQRRELIHLIPLKDNSKLIYQSYDVEKHLLFDVLWIKGIDEIWRIKYLSSDPANPVAHFADHIVRNSSGLLEKADSHEQILLQELKWHPRMARKGLAPFDQRSMTELSTLLFDSERPPYEVPKITTALCFKIAIPLISPLLVIALAPFCLIFSRQRHFFFLYAIGLFSLFACYMLLDSLTILSENGIISARIAIFLPPPLRSS
jgi:lipopolysaccharide export system permease protein